MIPLALCLMLAVPIMAEDAPADRSLCFLSGIETDARDSTLRGTKVEIICAHAEQRVVGLDEESTELQLLDGDRDLLDAGRQWLEERKKNGKSVGFSSEPWNALFVSNDRERHLELKAHSHALPESGLVRVTGTAALIMEADCVGADADAPAVVTVKASDLRTGAEIPFEVGAGGNLRAAERGFSGDSPMLALTGGGTFLGLIDPPEGVQTMQFFGKERLVVGESVADDTEVTLQVCPTRVVHVPVEIEARAITEQD